MTIKLHQIWSRFYRPSVSPAHQEKILAIRSELAAIGIATGRSRANRNGFTGIEGVEMKEAIEKLREFDLKQIDTKNSKISASGNEATFTHNSLLVNVKVKLSKEQSNGIRGVLNLPNPELLNRRPTILVFASGDQTIQQALNAGANLVGGEELVGQLIDGKLPEFNRCLATTSMLPTVLKLARILGPKALMPNVKTGTLVDSKDIALAVKRCLQSVPFKIEKNAGLMNMSIGSLKGSDEALIQNVTAVLDHLKKLSGSTASIQNRYIERVYLSTRDYPGIQIKL